MGLSFSTETGDGVKVSFPFAFVGYEPGYIRESDIHVYVRDSDPLSPDYNETVELIEDFEFPSPNVITLQSVIPAPLDGETNVLIRRIMPKDEIYADIDSDAIFRKKSLNNSFIQMLYTQHEALDGFYSEGVNSIFLIDQLFEITERSVRVQEGDTSTGAGVVLPNETTRANKVLGFDSAGDVVPVTITESTVIEGLEEITLPIVPGEVEYDLGQSFKTNNVVFVDGKKLPKNAYFINGNDNLEFYTPYHNAELELVVWNKPLSPTVLPNSKKPIQPFDTVQLMIDDITLTVGDAAKTYYFNSSVSCEWDIVANGTGAGDMSDGTLDLVGTPLQASLRIETTMTPKHFGAVADGVTDDAVAIQYCDDNCLNWVIDTPYGSSQLIINNHVDCLGEGVLKWVGINTNPVPVFVKVRAVNFGSLIIDAQDSEIQCIHVDGLVQQTCEDLIYKNIDAIDISKNVSAGVLVKTPKLVMRNAVCNNFVNTYIGGNDSNPQSLVVDSGSTLHIDKHVCTDGNSGVVNAGGVIYLESNECTRMQDNGIYNLAGSVTHVQHMSYSCDYGQQNEEPIVNQATLHCGELVITGKCIAVLRMDNAVYTNIGKVTGKAPKGTPIADLWSNLPTGLYQHRAGNTSSGECIIGSVDGLFTSSLFRTGFSSGSTDKLVVSNINVDLVNVDQIDVNPDWVKNNWFNLTGVNELHLTDITVRLWDINDDLTSDTGDYFYADYKLGLTIPSTIENFDVYIIGADRTPSAVGVFRGKAQQEFLKIQGGIWQTNVGGAAYMREADWQSGVRNSMSVNPETAGAGGYWRRGESYLAADGGVGTGGAFLFRCKITGSPTTVGSWEEL